MRSHLDFCLEAWYPYFVKDVHCVERVQCNENCTSTAELAVGSYTMKHRHHETDWLIDCFTAHQPRKAISAKKRC